MTHIVTKSYNLSRLAPNYPVLQYVHQSSVLDSRSIPWEMEMT